MTTCVARRVTLPGAPSNVRRVQTPDDTSTSTGNAWGNSWGFASIQPHRAWGSSWGGAAAATVPGFVANVVARIAAAAGVAVTPRVAAVGLADASVRRVSGAAGVNAASRARAFDPLVTEFHGVLHLEDSDCEYLELE